jgi:hypothetical protein
MSHFHTLITMVATISIAGVASAQTAPPPQGSYPTPMSQTTQSTYVPQSVALSGPRTIGDWNEGDPIPDGYHIGEKTRWGLVGGGLGMFVPAYLISLSAAGIGDAAGSGSQWWPLALPAVGPLIGIGTIHGVDGVGATVLVIDSGLQIGGLVMLVMGFQGRKVLIRNDLALEIQPMMNAGVTHTANGVQLNFTF